MNIGDATWFVGHRYEEYGALREFVLQQNPVEEKFKLAYDEYQKLLVTHSFAPNSPNERVQGLEHFLFYFLEYASSLNQNSVDALLSFFEVSLCDMTCVLMWSLRSSALHYSSSCFAILDP